MKTLKKDQLQEISNAIFAINTKSSERRASLVTSGEMKPEDSRKIAKKESELQKIANDLNHVVFTEVVADIQEPGNKIKIATDKVNEAVKKLKTVDDFIGSLAKVFNITSTIVGAFSTGNFLQIAGLLNQI